MQNDLAFASSRAISPKSRPYQANQGLCFNPLFRTTVESSPWLVCVLGDVNTGCRRLQLAKQKQRLLKQQVVMLTLEECKYKCSYCRNRLWQSQLLKRNKREICFCRSSDWIWQNFAQCWLAEGVVSGYPHPRNHSLWGDGQYCRQSSEFAKSGWSHQARCCQQTSGAWLSVLTCTLIWQ